MQKFSMVLKYALFSCDLNEIEKKVVHMKHALQTHTASE